MKHSFKMTNYKTFPDKIDIFAYEAGEYHNGPLCIRCGKGSCHHCHPEIYTEECTATEEPKRPFKEPKRKHRCPDCRCNDRRI